MSDHSRRLPRRLPLGLIVSSLFGLAASDTACALTLLVTDCTDGPSEGTLRNTIAAAPDNSIIQIPLTCSKISLTRKIVIPSAITNMYIVGQSPAATVIDGGSTSTPPLHDAIFLAENAGTVGLSQLTITHGDNTFGLGLGGCIYSITGSVSLNNAVVTGCMLSTAFQKDIKGGAIYAAGSVSLLDSIVSNSSAYGVPGYTAMGGGIFAKKGVDLVSSTISGNSAIAGVNALGSVGGGFYTLSGGGSLVSKSTISGNRADYESALEVAPSNNGYTLSIVSSTIANNVSNVFTAANSDVPTSVTNSTIAYNRAGFSETFHPVGLQSDSAVSINNSIFAGNSAGSGTAYDVHTLAHISGSKNLITEPDGPVPTDTLSSCPRLGHLSNNGGPTQTIPLLAHSPALDVGAANSASTDQRGTGFPRTVGAGTDIGAYERQSGVVDDVIFFSEFDARCN